MKLRVYGGQARRVWVLCVHSRIVNVDVRFRRKVNILQIRQQSDEIEKVKYLNSHALSGNGQHTLSVYTSVECGDWACVLPTLLSLVAVECYSNENNFLCEVVSSSFTGSHVGGFTQICKRDVMLIQLLFAVLPCAIVYHLHDTWNPGYVFGMYHTLA